MCIRDRLRGWLTRNRALHEPKRVTLIKMLGAGLLEERERSSETRDENRDENRAAGSGKNDAESRETRFINGVPLDANGRPVGVIATFPDPRYAAVDREGAPLPLEARKAFIPKPMPPAKRAYHPQAAPFGPKRRDGVWDGLEENPRDTDPRDPNEAAREKGLMPKAPPLVLTQAQFRRACEKSGVGAFGEADVRELFARRSRASGAEPEKDAETISPTPSRGPAGFARRSSASVPGSRAVPSPRARVPVLSLIHI